MDTERPLGKLQSLLHTMAKLYSGIVATVARRRATAYHANTGADTDEDIGQSLRAYIKHVKRQAATHTAPSTLQSATTDPTLPAETHAENSKKHCR